ncbi:MAG: GNAT family N-acetyltransferase [Candidatus Rokuibacteriota bacterium]
MALEIIPADTGRAFRAFIDVPYRLHRTDPHFVPPLRRERLDLFDRARHPFFLHAESAFFLARRSDRPAGRIEAIVNYAHNRFHADQVGFFGAFESENDRDVADALLTCAAKWLGQRGMRVMRGPVTHSTNEECGLLIEGFDEPAMIGMPYNPPYYATLLEAFGLTKAKDLYAWEVRAGSAIPDKIRRVAEMVRRDTGVVIRPVNLADYANEIRRAMDVYNASWTRNWGFVPLTEAEFIHAAEQVRPLIKRFPGGALLAEVGGRAVGFCLAVLDVNQALARVRDGRLFPFGFWTLYRGLRRTNQGRVMALGVRPEFRHRGIDALIYLELLNGGLRVGCRRAELGWTLEDNRVMNRAIRMGGRHHKTYRLYDLAIR